jgi:histidinol-phosphate/aromatic aminotransferase/cobyric acid decarboxylase-like protein
VIRVRSLTKDHGLAGLRVGYAIASPVLARRLEASRPPWTASTPAQAAIVAAVAHDGFVADCRARLLADRDAMVGRLAALDLTSSPSSTIYALVDLAAPPPVTMATALVDLAAPPPVTMATALVDLAARPPATALRARLLAEHAVAVRDCTSFGLPTHLRVAARPAADVDRLIAGLRAVLGTP